MNLKGRIFIFPVVILLFCFLLLNIGIVNINEIKCVYFNKEIGKMFGNYKIKQGIILGKCLINTKYGNINIKTGNSVYIYDDKIITFFPVLDNSINIFGNSLQDIKRLTINHDNDFILTVNQKLNIQNYEFEIENIYFNDVRLGFKLKSFSNILLGDNTYIELKCNDKDSIYVLHLVITDNEIQLYVINYQTEDYYFEVITNNKTRIFTDVYITKDWSNFIKGE